MKLFVIPNLMTSSQISLAKDVITSLKETTKSIISLNKNDSMKIYGNEEFFVFDESEADYIISIGGDACVLKAAKTSIKHNKPLIGINAGNLGYLCAYNVKEIDSLTPDSFNKLKKTHRSLLSVTLNKKTYFAINDAIIGKSNFGKTITVSVKCNDNLLAVWKGDGVIIATPTGSTAYNQSAGGPELRYDSKSFAVTPICPHLSKVKATVVSGDSVILVSSKKTPENIPTLYIDGTKIAELDGELSIKKGNEELILCIK